MAGLCEVAGHPPHLNIKPQVDEWTFAGEEGRAGHGIIVLSEGRLLNLGNATMGTRASSCPTASTNQVIAQVELFHQDGRVPPRRAYALHPSTWTRRWPGCTWTRWASSSAS